MHVPQIYGPHNPDAVKRRYVRFGGGGWGADGCRGRSCTMRGGVASVRDPAVGEVRPAGTECVRPLQADDDVVNAGRRRNILWHHKRRLGVGAPALRLPQGCDLAGGPCCERAGGDLCGLLKLEYLRCWHLLEGVVFDGEVESDLVHQDGGGEREEGRFRVDERRGGLTGDAKDAANRASCGCVHLS